MSLTEQQRRAVEAAGSVAVIAGAGTGKTHMLTERYLHHLAEDGLRPLEIVAGTFTEAAAAELRGRVRARLRGLPGLAHLAGELEAAQIGTLHSLAGRICREHPEAAGVPWDFAVQDELQQRVWLERHLREAILALPAELTDSIPFDTLRGSLSTLLADPFTAGQALACDPEEWPELIAAEKRRALEHLAAGAGWRRAVSTLKEYVGPEGDKLELQRRDALAAVARLEAGDFSSEVCAVLDGLSKRVGSAKAWGEAFAPVKEACGALREGYRSVRYAFDLELGPADETLRYLLPRLGEAYRSVEAQLAEIKLRERLLDFNDLELHALEALDHPEVRGFYRRRWRAFLVDEFQDTNPVQAELLTRLTGLPLSGEREARTPGEGWFAPARLTVVGDEKQSIYGFRRADLGVFRAAREAIEAGGGEVVELSTSFRTHHQLMEPLNLTFEPALAGLHQPLTGARVAGSGSSPFLSVRLVVSEERVLKQFRQRAEAHAIGELIEEFLREGVPVHDKASGELRPAGPGDVAILARTWDTLGPYGDELAARGIPTIHAGGGDLLAQREVKDALSLLRFLADPADDLALAAVLRSPFFAIDDPRLLWLAERARSMSVSWWDVLTEELPGRDAFGRVPAPSCDEVLGTAARLLEDLLRSRRDPPSRLLAMADDLTGYSAVIANLPGGQRRLVDWRGFVEFVGQLERGQEGLFSVVRDLRTLTSLEDVKVPRPGMEANDAVSLMSVHNAKGLEWPIVIIPDMTAPAQSKGAPTLFEAHAGLAFRVQDEAGEHLDPALYTVLSQRRKEREAEEELRVLYVALTRARDRVVLSGSEEEGGRLRSLAEGLEAAGVDPIYIPFDAADAVPKAPRPEALAAGGEQHLGEVGPGLFEVPVTSISTYVTCPRRFHFEQVLQHPGVTGGTNEPEDAGEPGAGRGVAARIGDLTHKALQFGIEAEGALAALDPTLEPELVRQALAFADAFRRAPVFTGVRERIEGREIPLAIDGGAYGSALRLHGVVDAVAPDFVLDYKTGSGDRQAHLLQVAVYAGALGRDRAFVAYLREERLEEYSAAELRGARVEIGAALQGMEAGEFGARPGRQKCLRCAFEPICEESSLRRAEWKEVQATSD